LKNKSIQDRRGNRIKEEGNARTYKKKKNQLKKGRRTEVSHPQHENLPGGIIVGGKVTK